MKTTKQSGCALDIGPGVLRLSMIEAGDEKVYWLPWDHALELGKALVAGAEEARRKGLELEFGEIEGFEGN